MPKKPEIGTKRRQQRKVPSWHLTGEETMNYIEEVSNKQLEKKKKEEKYEKAKKEAVEKVKKEERSSGKKVTRLYRPAPKPKLAKRVR